MLKKYIVCAHPVEEFRVDPKSGKSILDCGHQCHQHGSFGYIPCILQGLETPFAKTNWAKAIGWTPTFSSSWTKACTRPITPGDEKQENYLCNRLGHDMRVHINRKTHCDSPRLLSQKGCAQRPHPYIRSRSRRFPRGIYPESLHRIHTYAT